MFLHFAPYDSQSGMEVETRAPRLDPRDQSLLRMFVNMPSKVTRRNIKVHVDADEVAEKPDGKLCLTWRSR